MTAKTDDTILSTFFELGQEESKSPFLIPKTRSWGVNLTLKSALAASFLLVLSFILSFYTPPLAHFLLVLVYFLVGIPALIEAIEDLAVLEVNIDVLMTLAAFSSVLIGSGMEGALLLVLFALSHAMEDAVTAKAKDALQSLHKLSPTTALVMEENGEVIEKSLHDVDVGAKILIKAGEIVPLDGKVIHGTSSVNLVHLTGENFPVTKTIRDDVPAGAKNLEGALQMEVTRTSTDSTLARIIQLVTEAQSQKPTLQRWFDSLSRAYAITIITLSFLFALSFPLLLGIPFLGQEGSLYRALAFLIAASPCALIIAIPIAYLSAISVCAKMGVLLKGGMTLDALASCKNIAFDKTGTLTTGELRLERIETKGDKTQALVFAASLEQNAVHPIAKAIEQYAKEKRVKPIALDHFKVIPGYGLEGETQGKKLYIGNPEYIKDFPKEKIEEIRKQGKLIALLLVDNEPTLFIFTDTPREGIHETLTALKTKRKMQLIMLTGDHAQNALHIADEFGIDDYYADLKPEDKVRHVSQLSDDHGLAMVGDGINDAPALARATVGIAMGKVGSETAIDASDIVLLQDNLELLDWLVGKAQKTQVIVRQNLIVATFAIIFASIPALAGLVPLWLAVIMHEGGTVLVGLNALRLLR
jgi:heavy metal translocating P-type ATPase